MDEEQAAAVADDKQQDERSDVFLWANNLVQYKDDLKVDVFLINKNYIVYKTARGSGIAKQLEPIFPLWLHLPSCYRSICSWFRSTLQDSRFRVSPDDLTTPKTAAIWSDMYFMSLSS